MFGFFKTNISRAEAIKKLRKLDAKRRKLLKIINGHVVLENEIEHGVVVINDQSVRYRIKSEGFGLYNLYSMDDNLFLQGGYSQNKILRKSLSKYELANALNDNGFRLVDE